MQIREEIDLTPYTTFRLGCPVRYFGVVNTLDDLKKGYIFAEEKNVPVVILGGGSNIIIRENKTLEAVVLKMEIKEFEIIKDDTENTVLHIGAGEIWDDVVRRTVEMNLSGIEAMSWIPGTVGATPIQNVGAYGQEIKDTLVSVDALEIATGEIKIFPKEECQFKYRDSIFKNEAKDKYIIVGITLSLSKKPAMMPNYPGVKKYFEEQGIENPTLLQIREAIIAIRNVKLPDPRKIASVGSFFKNPFITKEQYTNLIAKYPNAVAFPLPDGNYKIGAGWLIDSLGLKGKEFGNLMFYPHNALVVVNKGGATYEELQTVVADVKNKVKENFGIELEQEPVEI